MKSDEHVDCQNKTAAAACFRSLVGKINDCFKEIHLVGEDGMNDIIKKDAAKIGEIAAAKGRDWERAFAAIFLYYEKLFDLMNTLIVSEEEEFENLEIVCGHFHMPPRIFMRHFVNYDVSIFVRDIENLRRILKNHLL